jgi:hypothetical protein
MSDSNIWSVDRLAAKNLLANLKLENATEITELVTEHFARHRRYSMGWAAERAHAFFSRKLQATPPSYIARDNEEWMDGFRFAEQQILTTVPEEMLELGPTQTRTKGQILRGLVRQARNDLSA